MSLSNGCQRLQSLILNGINNLDDECIEVRYLHTNITIDTLLLFSRVNMYFQKYDTFHSICVLDALMDFSDPLLRANYSELIPFPRDRQTSDH